MSETYSIWLYDVLFFFFNHLAVFILESPWRVLGNGLHGIQLVLSCKCTTETAKNSCSYVILLYIVASQPSQLRHSKNHREIWFILCWCQTTNNISWFYLNNEANVASPTLLKTEIHKSIILWFWYIFDQIPPAVSGLIRVLVGPLMQRLTVSVQVQRRWRSAFVLRNI